MPKQKPGKSEQVVCTPTEFLKALKGKLGIKEFYIDLAASADNCVSPLYYDENDDSLNHSWSKYDKDTTTETQRMVELGSVRNLL